MKYQKLVEKIVSVTDREGLNMIDKTSCKIKNWNPVITCLHGCTCLGH